MSSLSLLCHQLEPNDATTWAKQKLTSRERKLRIGPNPLPMCLPPPSSTPAGSSPLPAGSLPSTASYQRLWRHLLDTCSLRPSKRGRAKRGGQWELGQAIPRTPHLHRGNEMVSAGLAPSIHLTCRQAHNEQSPGPTLPLQQSRTVRVPLSSL